jgi:hypothetical protein
MAAKLRTYLDGWRARPWEWGVSDCCTFVADRVLSTSGLDIMREYRGAYDDEAGALDMLAFGGGLPAMLEAVRAELGPIPEAAVLRFRNGVEVGGLARDGWAHWFSPKGVHSWRLERVDIRTFT